MHEDIAGMPICIGDYIIYAALWDRSATLKYGKVTRLAERDEAWTGNPDRKKVPTLRLRSVDRDWHGKWELQRGGKETTLGFMDRLMVVLPAQVPEEARSLLDG